MVKVNREFLHSQSRIVDRLLQAEKDYDRIIDDAKRIIQDAKVAKEDVVKIRSAIETMFNDLIKTGKIRKEYKDEHKKEQ